MKHFLIIVFGLVLVGAGCGEKQSATAECPKGTDVVALPSDAFDNPCVVATSTKPLSVDQPSVKVHLKLLSIRENTCLIRNNELESSSLYGDINCLQVTYGFPEDYSDEVAHFFVRTFATSEEITDAVKKDALKKMLERKKREEAEAAAKKEAEETEAKIEELLNKSEIELPVIYNPPHVTWHEN